MLIEVTNLISKVLGPNRKERKNYTSIYILGEQCAWFPNPGNLCKITWKSKVAHRFPCGLPYGTMVFPPGFRAEETTLLRFLNFPERGNL